MPHGFSNTIRSRLDRFGCFLSLEDPDSLLATIRRDLEPWPEITIKVVLICAAGHLRIFDRTFAITDALQWLAMIVALAGLAIAGVSLVLERRREWAVLRAMGWNRRQLTTMAWQQNAWHGLLATLWAIPLAAMIGWLLMAVINKRSFGWTIDWYWPLAPTIGVLALGMATAIRLAAWSSCCSTTGGSNFAR